MFIHLLPLAVGRVRVLRVYLAISLSLVHLVDPTWVIAGWNLATGWRVSNRRKLRPTWSRGIILSTGRLVRVSRWFAASVGSARSLFFNFALVVFFFLTLLPLLSNFLELYRNALVGAKLMLVKRNHRIPMGNIRLHAIWW